MEAHGVSMDVALDAAYRAQFALIDVLRRAQGSGFEALGLGPDECRYRIAAAGRFWRLREYSRHGTRRSLLIIAAPIKRSYIWDLAPSVSAIRYCLERGLQVWLLEWLPASKASGNNGLYEHAAAIGECVRKISGKKPFLIGHSLGGTLAAFYAASDPESVSGLVLLEAPLCFRPAMSRFWDALVFLVPSGLAEAEPYPGSLISQMSILASPRAFIWERLRDAAISLASHDALEIHARVERWILDEVSLPGKLVHEIIEWLCRENRLCRGSLRIGDMLIGPRTLSVPTLAVVNTADEVAPLDSVRPFIETMPTRDTRIIEYPGEFGVCLQHLGILIGPQARARVWPEIISWIDAHCGSAPRPGSLPPRSFRRVRKDRRRNHG